MVDVCHRLSVQGFVAATDGNVSARTESGTILATRTAVNKGMVTPNDIVEIDPEGNLMPGAPSDARPSTEMAMHLYIYRERPDVHAVVHAHPVTATGFATARQPLDLCLFPEVIVGLGAIPLAEYATPSTGEVAASLAPFVHRAQAILLSNHGAVTYGADLYDAYFKMEKVEHAARIAFIARMLGGERPLSPEQVEKLRSVSVASYGKDFSGLVACAAGAPALGPETPPPSDEELRELVRQMIGGKR